MIILLASILIAIVLTVLVFFVFVPSEKEEIYIFTIDVDSPETPFSFKLDGEVQEIDWGDGSIEYPSTQPKSFSKTKSIGSVKALTEYSHQYVTKGTVVMNMKAAAKTVNASNSTGQNKITEINIPNITNAENFFAGGNKLKEAVGFLKNLIYATFINLNDNLIENASFEANLQLQILNMRQNALTGILNFSKNQKLQELDLANNNLTGIEVSGLQNLISVNVSGNPDIAYDPNQNKNVEILDLRNSNLTGMQVLSGFPNLKELNCSQNAISNLEIFQCPKLEIIDGSSNQLVDFSIALTPVKELNLANNLLSFANIGLKISNSQTLQKLLLNQNQYVTINVTLFSNLEILNVNENLLTDIILSSNNSKIINLQAQTNSLTIESISNILAVIRANNIVSPPPPKNTLFLNNGSNAPVVNPSQAYTDKVYINTLPPEGLGWSVTTN